MQRVVVTGLGAVTPLAAGVEASWSRHLPGRSGIRTLPNEVGLEPSYTILELTDQVAPPTLNLSAPDPAYDGMDLNLEWLWLWRSQRQRIIPTLDRQAGRRERKPCLLQLSPIHERDDGENDVERVHQLGNGSSRRNR
jgi:hypothetical protein